MRRSLAAALGLALTSAVAALSADVPFGADGLPYLARRASLVVEVAEARALEPTAAFVLFELKTRRVLQGTRDLAAPLVALAPRAPGVPEARTLTGSLVFLAGPLDAAGAKQRGVPPDRPVYEMVGGRTGVIAASDERAAAAAREYLALKEPTARLAWARKEATDPDPFVQRSALLEFAEPGRELADDAVVSVLLESLRSERVRADNKGVAVQLLEQSQSPRAAAALAELARSPSAPAGLRQEAVRALSTLPGGEEPLREFQAGKDPLLAPAARKALELTRPEVPSRASADVVRQYRAQLASDDPRVRREGAVAAGKLEYSADLVKDLRTSALNPKETSPSVRLAAIESLSRFSQLDSAEALKDVASDETLPRSVRAAAVMGMARLETGVGLTALKQLADRVRDPEIKKLAAGLADQR
jgi:hypothetical protein